MSHSYWHGGVWKALDRATRAHGFNTLLEKMASTTLLVGLTEKGGPLTYCSYPSFLAPAVGIEPTTN